MKKGRITNHAERRMVERVMVGKTKKVTKRQIEYYHRYVNKNMSKDMDDAFAYAYSKDNKCIYYYVKMNEDGICIKYVIDKYNKKVVTVINDINFNSELKKIRKIYLKANHYDITHYAFTDYVKCNLLGNSFLFVVDPDYKNIYSFNHLKTGGALC